MSKAIVSLSGGMDSVTLLAFALQELGVENVEAVGFSYGSKHNKYENAAAHAVAKHYGVPFKLIDFTSIAAGFTSHLLKDGGAIPEGHYEAASMAQTVVPGRNIIFAAILSGLAWSRDVKHVYLGIHSGDHAIYPDCRPAFFYAMKAALMAGTDNRVNLLAPFLQDDKTKIIKWGLQHDVPYNMTRTCYQDAITACGRCGACQERLAAFAANGIEDPIPYQSRVILPKE